MPMSTLKSENPLSNTVRAIVVKINRLIGDPTVRFERTREKSIKPLTSSQLASDLQKIWTTDDAALLDNH